MKASEIRQQFFDFFESKGHKIVESAPIVNKDDPTLMFTNAGMNQFKDYFLGNKPAPNKRVADTQKCLRVSGKHNDLEEVGIDSYHHTMFEMLGNWSFGDYFKKEAINWAWELLVDKYGLDKERLYATCFEGDAEDNLKADTEAADYWRQFLPEDRILYCDRKDNFWEMGETGPCGPCSEIHVDLRSDADRAKVNGKDLVNKDHPQVVEIWNLVFIQYNRKADRSLENLPEQHVDTGMGFERLCMAMQGKMSNYDTDVFTPFIELVEAKTGKKYTGSYDVESKKDIAMRVIVDHVRAVCFTIADGQLPSNTGAGYVIRRILRRAVRYYYSFLDYSEPLLHELVDPLANAFADVFPGLAAQKDFVSKVVREEERSFLRTLEEGLKKLDQIEAKNGVIEGKVAFELFDTYGFPIDLTRLIVGEQGLKIDDVGFEKALQEQKERSRADAKKVMGDWIHVNEDNGVEFVGYDSLTVTDSSILRHRTVMIKDKPQYQIVLSKTPFYPEGGGQVGDSGHIKIGTETITVIDTKKENDLIVHIINKLPADMSGNAIATVNKTKRSLTENNHSATHLLHAAMKQVLGDHVNQKGSLVNGDYLRFDFSHFQKVSQDELAQIEAIVNTKIRENIPLEEDRSIPIAEAKESGAMMLFGEKYGDEVRMITFDPNYSVELCGGCHVEATGQIGTFKIRNESSVAAGVRRIEALTAIEAEEYINTKLQELNDIQGLFKNSENTVKRVFGLQEENKDLLKQIESLKAKQSAGLQDHLKTHFEDIKGVNFLGVKLPISDMKSAKTIAYNLEKSVGNALIVFGIENGEKANLMVAVSESLTKEDYLHAGNIIKDISSLIQGGGGGQAFFATAGGKDKSGIEAAIAKAKELI